MKKTIDGARTHLNQVVPESIREINQEEYYFIIRNTQFAIDGNDSYQDISQEIFNALNQKLGEKRQWNAVAFAIDGGESLIVTKHYLRLRFNKLIIEVFVARGVYQT